MKLGVIANVGKPHAADILRRLASFAQEHGFEVWARAEAARLLPGARVCPDAEIGNAIDVLVALGGDGTLLYAARMLGDADVPILGVNLGGLGFMTSVSEDRLGPALAALAEGRYSFSTRTRLACRLLQGDSELGPYQALNDMVIGWGESSRIVTLGVRIDGEEMCEYRCDGLIVCTPTGSTGHSLSAGGPIIHPRVPEFMLNPICPHTLSNRAIIVPDSSRIEVTVRRSEKRQLLVIDGQDRHAMAQGDRVEIIRAPSGVRFIHLPGYSYFSVLRRKLHWHGATTPSTPDEAVQE